MRREQGAKEERAMEKSSIKYGGDGNLAKRVASLLEVDIANLNNHANDQNDKNSPQKPLFSAKDFSVFDHLHSRGRASTQELSEYLSAHPGSKLLDIGCGIGGPARFIAERFVCKVYGIDLTKDFCETAILLNRLCGLDKRIDITHGNACDMPYDDGHFDIVWTQHTSMNIADKKTFYSEIKRVLKPGGTFLFHDIFSNDTLKTSEERQIQLPVPWASQPEHNHLITGEATRDILKDLGFHREIWTDVTAETHLWFHNYSATDNDDHKLSKELNPALFIGKDFPERAKNLKKNLALNKTSVIQGVFRKC
ncbi:class I SAM-dependent methyltransferase [Kiloniella sp. EL199]|uniref:class I SAM-dependent methyltransferase n=1 Tax=Kiloniella sp. EL199 TaxID=2107581 RepID=UPI0013C4574E|nr:class I SAM-dependent methyltransferase [Kiloniella sp. EL199]